MKIRRILMAGLALDCTVAVIGAGAAIVAGPDVCPVPADAEPYAAPAEIAADEDELLIDLQDGMVVLKDIELDDGTDGAFSRLILDPGTGLPPGAGDRRASEGCKPAD